MAEGKSNKLGEAAVKENGHGLVKESESFKLSGPGVHSATANHQTHILLDLTETPGSGVGGGPPYSVSAQLKAEGSSKLPGWLKKKPRTDIVVTEKSPSQFLIEYGTTSRGKYKLHVRVNNSELQGSPFDITTYPDPSQLRPQSKELPSMGLIWGLASNPQGELLVTTFGAHRVLVLNKKGVEVRSIGDKGYGPTQRVKDPMGITVDGDGNVYVGVEVKVMKFGADGSYLDSVGKLGRGNGEFNMPDGMVVYNGELYVCDKGNNRIQVFDTDLNFKRVLKLKAPEGRPRQLNAPYAIDVDSSTGKAYIADSGTNRVVVVELPTGEFVREIGHEEGEGKLYNPTGLHVVAEFLYVSDDDNCRDIIYRTTGELVATLPRGSAIGPVKGPCRFTSDRNGFVYSLGPLGKYTIY